jgi:hypothetical protein
MNGNDNGDDYHHHHHHIHHIHHLDSTTSMTRQDASATTTTPPSRRLPLISYFRPPFTYSIYIYFQLLLSTSTVPCSPHRLCLPSTLVSIRGTSNSRSVRLFFLFMFCHFLTFFWPQTTMPPEIPQAVAVANPTVAAIQINHTPVRGAFSSLGMKFWVRINVLCAFIFFDSLFFSQ